MYDNIFTMNAENNYDEDDSYNREIDERNKFRMDNAIVVNRRLKELLRELEETNAAEIIDRSETHKREDLLMYGLLKAIYEGRTGYDIDSTINELLEFLERDTYRWYS